MDSLKIKTLEQVDAALEEVEEARAAKNLSPADKLKLETAAVKLRNLERSIIKLVQKELVTALTNDSAALKDLSAQIAASSAKLSGVADTIQKAASFVESFIKIITAVAASGIL